MILSARLRQLRTSRALTQDQVAALIGVDQSTISAYECELRQPSYSILIRFANLYRVTTDYLLGRDNRAIDVSGLSDDEIALISELVETMTAKNIKLEELR